MLLLVYKFAVLLISIFFIVFACQILTKMDDDKTNLKDVVFDFNNSYAGSFIYFLGAQGIVDQSKVVRTQDMAVKYFKSLRDILISLIAFSAISILLIISFMFSSLTLVTFPTQVVIFVIYIDAIIKLYL